MVMERCGVYDGAFYMVSRYRALGAWPDDCCLKAPRREKTGFLLSIKASGWSCALYLTTG
jgi:hypothetical protein